MPTNKPLPGSFFEPFTLSKFGGGELEIGGARKNWALIVVYRGKHCGRCKKYLKALNDKKYAWGDAGFDVIAISADPMDKVSADVAEFGWTFDVGYDLNEEQMVALGVYVSDPLSSTETDRRFAEPGVFVIKPDGSLLLVSISNGPSARPDLTELLDGMIFTKSNDRPPRGLA